MRKRLAFAFLVTLFVFAGSTVNLFVQAQSRGNFKVPDARTRQAAIGSLEGVPEPLRSALIPGDAFDPVPAPKGFDWLACHEEEGQTYSQYKRSGANRPDDKRDTIYIQPIGEFDKASSPDIDLLMDYTARFYMMKVVVLNPIPLKDGQFSPRERAGYTQILTTDILAALRKQLPKNAYCLLGVTMTDLYPDPEWNYVFGVASLRSRVGVYSFARYDPAFHGDERGEDYQKVILGRSCKVLAHEACHMFGIKHCVYFNCLMNGANHLAESDSQPQTLCPVCLRKLLHATGRDVVKRYEGMAEFFKQHDFADESAWLEKRLKDIQ